MHLLSIALLVSTLSSTPAPDTVSERLGVTRATVDSLRLPAERAPFQAVIGDRAGPTSRSGSSR